MHPVLRLIFVVVGAALGADLASGGTELLAALVGALTGLAVGEVVSIRNTLAGLRSELRELSAQRDLRATKRETAETARPPPTPTTSPRPASEPPRSQSIPQSTARAETGHGDGLRDRAQPFPPRELPAHGAPSPTRHPAEIPIVALLWNYFTGGNALVRGGIIVLFFGVAFLLRYLAEHSHIPMALRLSTVAVGALVLLVFGWRLRVKRPGYALALQGGAVGILYLTVFSALHVYALLSPTAASALLAAISALSATLAVSQSSLAVALLSVTGGFLAPFLASTGHGDHVALFSYFALLNALILGIAWYRSWRLLNVAGFVFTFVLSAVWGVLQYRPRDFATSEPFLAIFFLLYVGIAVLYSTRQESEPARQGYMDATIVFGTPLSAFGLQAAMLHDHPLALAGSALAVAALYMGLAWVLYRYRRDGVRLLVQAFAALGTAFLTLAVPLALNARWSAASWALEGAALVWVGCRQNRRAPRAFGALLQLAAGGALAFTVTTEAVVPAGTNVAALMVGIASVYAAQALHAGKAQLDDYESGFSGLLFLWGLLWWSVGGICELRQELTPAHWLAATLAFATATALLGGALASRARMRISLLPTLALLPAMLLCALWGAFALHHPLAQGGWVAWPVAFLGLYFTLRQHDQALAPAAMDALHAAGAWLLATLVCWELSWRISQLVVTGAWAILAWAVVPAAALAALPTAVARSRWPFQAHRAAYAVLIPAGLVLYLAWWSIYADATVSSPSAPLPYLPLANPLDLVQALVLVALVRDWRRLRSEPSTLTAIDPRAVSVGLALVGFLWLNATLLRTLHMWMGIPYAFEAMMRSTLAESALSLLWAVLALTTMLSATRFRARLMWLTGATLLVIVVVKLFLVDLASIGGIERIVSFVGVGLLMLVIGYFSPLPPAAGDSR
ncbi:MAG: DUF2339 domain-containing protein [Steroidobacteraceae bacterium]